MVLPRVHIEGTDFASYFSLVFRTVLSSTYQTRYTIPLIPQLLPSVSSLCYHLRVLWNQRGWQYAEHTNTCTPINTCLWKMPNPGRQVQCSDLHCSPSSAASANFSSPRNLRERRQKRTLCKESTTRQYLGGKKKDYFHWFGRRDIINRTLKVFYSM